MAVFLFTLWNMETTAIMFNFLGNFIFDPSDLVISTLKVAAFHFLFILVYLFPNNMVS